MGSDHRTISGRRADLTDVRGPEHLRRVALEGPGIASLEGIERMTNLDTLFLERLSAPALRRLEALVHLRILVIDDLRGAVDYGPLQRLPALEYLSITARGDAGRQVAAADLSGLTRLCVLKLFLLGEAVVLDAPWLTALPRLDHFTPASRAQRTSAMTSEIGSVVTDLNDMGVAKLGTIFEHGADDELAYSLGLDLAESFQLETNLEAEVRLIDALRIRAPELLEGLQFDTESSAVWLISKRREVLEAVRSLAADLTR